MKKNKCILIILLVFVFSGCTANYDVEIYNDEIRQDFSFYETDSTKWNLSSSNKKEEDLEGTEDVVGNSYREVINNDFKQKTHAFSEQGEIYQRKTLISDSSKLGLSYKYNYKIHNFSEALIPKNTFKYFNVLSSNNIYIISTSKGVAIDAFENYKYLNTVTVHLKTNHKVKESNADRVDKYHYYWDINETNYKDKSIYIELYKDKYVFNYDNKVIKTLIVIGIVAILVLTVIIVLRRKAIKNNEI